MSATYAAATSYLLSHGWVEHAITPAASSWTKRGAMTIVPYELEPGTLGWKQFLLGIASAEAKNPADVERAILTQTSTVVPRPTSDRTELDLHLSGPGVREHETDAWRFGQFVSAVADAVNELVKDSVHLGRHLRELQILGGATEGSVRVQLREPEQTIDLQDPLFITFGEAPEARALRTLCQIFNSANEAAQKPVDSILEAHVRLDLGARRALSRLARIMSQASWNANGHLLSRSDQPIVVELSLAGAHRLRLATQDTEERVEVRTYHGILDGWAWSDGEMRLLADSGVMIRAAVPADQQLRVAGLIAEPDQRVTASFQVLERLGPKGSRSTIQHALVSITVESKLTDS